LVSPSGAVSIETNWVGLPLTRKRQANQTFVVLNAGGPGPGGTQPARPHCRGEDQVACATES